MKEWDAPADSRKKLQRKYVLDLHVDLNSWWHPLYHYFKWQMEVVIIIMIWAKEIKAGNGTYRLTDLLSCAFVGVENDSVSEEESGWMKHGIATNTHWQMSLALVNLSAKGQEIIQYLLCGIYSQLNA